MAQNTLMRYQLRMSMRVLIQTLSARTPLCQSPSVHAIYEIPDTECLFGFVGIHTERQTQGPWGGQLSLVSAQPM